MEIILGTKNKGKLKEFLKLLENLKEINLKIFPLPENIKDAKEEGNSFLENAYLKAKAYFDILKTSILSDDSGLEVYIPEFKMSSYYLPGIYSSRFFEFVKENLSLFLGKFSLNEKEFINFLSSIENMDKDKRNIKVLLKLLESKYKEDLKKLKIKAAFVSYLCLYRNENFFIFSRGKVEGKIYFEERGERGFGYDPIFFYEDFQKTFAEIPLEKKNKISHRGKAFLNLINNLKEVKHELER